MKKTLTLFLSLFLVGCLAPMSRLYKGGIDIEKEALQYEQSGNYKEAIVIYQKLLGHKISRKKRLNVLDRIITLYEKTGDRMKAIEYLKTAIDYDKDNGNLWLRLGNTYSDVDLNQEALEAYEHALTLNCNKYEVYYGLGKTYRRLGHYKQSEKWLEGAQAILPNDERILFEMARLYEEKGELDRSTTYWQKLTELSKQDRYFARLGFIYLLRRIPDEAIKSFQKARELDGKNKEYEMSEGFSFYLKGDFTKAEERYSSCIGAGNPLLLPYLLDAMAAYKNGKYAKTLKDIEKIDNLLSAQWLAPYVDYLKDSAVRNLKKE